MISTCSHSHVEVHILRITFLFSVLPKQDLLVLFSLITSEIFQLQSVSWSLAEFRHNKIVQLLRENCFNVCLQLQRKVRSRKHDV